MLFLLAQHEHLKQMSCHFIKQLFHSQPQMSTWSLRLGKVRESLGFILREPFVTVPYFVRIHSEEAGKSQRVSENSESRPVGTVDMCGYIAILKTVRIFNQTWVQWYLTAF